MISKETVLVTGATGSFGKKFIQTIFERYTPEKVIVYSRDEMKQFEMQNNPVFVKHEKKIKYVIGDVRDERRLLKAMENVDIVIHAAAMKIVPAAEYNPSEAVKTNIMGAQNVIDACRSIGVKRVIALSTDKAAAPINLYGATKLVSDKLFVAANKYEGEHTTRFSVVRYGNVLGSRGSVVPFFTEKKKTGIIPITDERMTRFSITLQEGVDFVLDCLKRMWGGELFVPKTPSYKILDVAKAIAPECKINVVGIRPGEKIHEELITETDSLNTVEFKKYFVILPSLDLWNTDEFRRESSDHEGKFCEVGYKYSSGNNTEWYTIEQLRTLIAEIG